MGRRADGEDRRRAILAATAALLRERPIADISVADIAARAGVVRSGFYFYFPTRGAAVAAVLGDVSEEMLAGAVSFLADDVDGEAAVRSAMWAGWRAWSAHRDLILGVLDARGTDPGVRELWDAWAQRFVVTIGDAVADKRARGLAAAGGDPRDLLTVLTGAVERTFERMSRPSTGSDAAAGLVETLVGVWSLAIFGTYAGPGSADPTAPAPSTSAPVTSPAAPGSAGPATPGSPGSVASAAPEPSAPTTAGAPGSTVAGASDSTTGAR